MHIRKLKINQLRCCISLNIIHQYLYYIYEKTQQKQNVGRPCNNIKRTYVFTILLWFLCRFVDFSFCLTKRNLNENRWCYICPFCLYFVEVSFCLKGKTSIKSNLHLWYHFEHSGRLIGYIHLLILDNINNDNTKLILKYTGMTTTLALFILKK